MKIKLLRSLFIACLISLFAVSAQGQTEGEPDYDRMLRRLHTAHEGIFKLPYDSEYIQSEILQQVYKKREELCPNYPGRNNSLSLNEEGYKSWLMKHENEYHVYINYLEKMLRSHHQ